MREIASIAVPVSLEMVIQLVLTFINQIIVGVLGAVAVAAVGLTGSLSFLFFVTLGALGSGTSILIARRAGPTTAQVSTRPSASRWRSACCWRAR